MTYTVTVTTMCTCVGIHPGQVEPASPIELTTLRPETPFSLVMLRGHRTVRPSHSFNFNPGDAPGKQEVGV